QAGRRMTATGRKRRFSNTHFRPKAEIPRESLMTTSYQAWLFDLLNLKPESDRSVMQFSGSVKRSTEWPDSAHFGNVHLPGTATTHTACVHSPICRLTY